MKKLFLSLVCSFIVGSCLATPTADEENSDPEMLLATPSVPAKASASVGRHMQTIEKWFKKHDFTTKYARNGEVLVVLIPTDELFQANEDVLRPEALKRLDVFERAIINPEAYRMLVWVHADDTGDEQYSDSLTNLRAENIQAVFEQIASRKGVKSTIYFTGFGSEKPLKPNDSLANRQSNRRVEVYIVPLQRTIDNARSGKL